MTYWKVTDKVLTGTVNFWKCTSYSKFCLPLVVWIWKSYLLIYVLDGIFNEKKIKYSHDSKIPVQVFNTLSSKFPQIITNLTEDTELAFTERLERLYLIIILLIMLLSHILNESNSNFAVKFSYECSSSFPKFYVPFRSSFICSELSFKSSIFKIRIFQGNAVASFFKVAKNNYLRLFKISSLLWVFHFMNMFCILFLTSELLFFNGTRNAKHCRKFHFACI